MQPLTPRPIVDCPVCHNPLRSVGRMPVRKDAAEAQVFIQPSIGDTSPALALDVYRCGNCGRLEFYDHDFQLPAL